MALAPGKSRVTQIPSRRTSQTGQAGAIAAPATIMNAVMNALAPLGVTHLDMPATPSRIWHAIRAAQR